LRSQRGNNGNRPFQARGWLEPYVIPSNLGDTAGGIDINDEVKANIRNPRVSEAIK
jgi:hypothetical protein